MAPVQYITKSRDGVEQYSTYEPVVEATENGRRVVTEYGTYVAERSGRGYQQRVGVVAQRVYDSEGNLVNETTYQKVKKGGGGEKLRVLSEREFSQEGQIVSGQDVLRESGGRRRITRIYEGGVVREKYNPESKKEPPPTDGYTVTTASAGRPQLYAGTGSGDPFAVTPYQERPLTRREQLEASPIYSTLNLDRAFQEQKQSSPVPRGEIRAQTQEEQRAVARSRNPIVQFSRSALGGFLLTPEAARQARGDAATGAQRAGAGVGVVGSIIAAGSSELILSPAARTVRGTAAAVRSSRAARLAMRAADTRLGRLVFGVSRAGAEGVTIVEGGSRVARYSAPEEQRRIMSLPSFDRALSQAYAAERKAIASQPVVRRLGYELTIFASNQGQQFRKGLIENLRESGYTDAQINVALQASTRQRTGRGVAEIAALLRTSQLTEGFGRREVAKTFAKAAQENLIIPLRGSGIRIAGKVFFPIGRAGVVEGASQEITQEYARSQNIQAREIAKMGALGGVSAGVLGSIIGGLYRRPFAQKGVEYATYLIDPLEKPGDIAQDALEALGRRFGREYPSPQIILPENTQGVRFATTQSKGYTPRASPNLVVASIFTPPQKPTKTVSTPPSQARPPQIPSLSYTVMPETQAPSPGKGGSTRSTIPTLPSLPDVSFPTGSFSSATTPFPTPVPLPVPETPLPVPSLVPSDVPSNSNIPSLIPATVPTNVPANILSTAFPTVTPQFRAPPPFFPTLGGFGSGFDYGKGKRPVRFVNELRAGRDLLRQTLGYPPPKATTKGDQKKSRKKKRRKQEPSRSQARSRGPVLPGFNEPLFRLPPEVARWL